MDRRKGFDLYHTEIVIIRKEICPTSKFENIDQVTFKLTLQKIIYTRSADVPLKYFNNEYTCRNVFYTGMV